MNVIFPSTPSIPSGYLPFMFNMLCVLCITPIQSICDYPYHIRGSVQHTKTSGNTLHGCDIFVLILQTDGSLEWLAFLYSYLEGLSLF